MSQNVDRGLEACDAWNAGNFAAFVRWFDPQYEFHTSGVWPSHDSVYCGERGLRTYWDTFRAAWESVEAHVERAEDVGDQVLALLVFRAKGRASGIDAAMNVGAVYTFANGLMIECRTYADWDQALDAVGLRE